MELILFIVTLLIFALAALRWGADSRDGIDSPEWRRRQEASWQIHGTDHSRKGERL